MYCSITRKLVQGLPLANVMEALPKGGRKKGNKIWTTTLSPPRGATKHSVRAGCSSCEMKTIKPIGLFKQVWLAATASLGYLTIGLVRGFSSPALASMASINPELIPNEKAASWIAAVPPLGAFVGSLFSGPMMQHLGRKGTLVICAPLFAGAWLGIAFSSNWIHVVVARAFTGLCVGVVLPSAQVYVSECAHPQVRGMVGSLPALFMAGGILAAYVLGTLLDWNYLAISSAVFPTLLTILLIPLPESPVWLRAEGKNKKADDALSWLHREPIATIEMCEVTSPKEEDKDVSPPKIERSMSTISQAIRLKSKSLFRMAVMVPFGLAASILIFQQISGIDVIIFYTVSIFQASGSTMGEYEATIMVGACQVVATFLALFLADYYGRTTLLFTSGVIMGIAMTALGGYFYYQEKGEADSLGLLPLGSQLLFIAGFSIGFGNIPFILMGELLPLAHRSVLSSLAGACNLGSMFLIIKTYYNTVLWIGMQGAFWLYAAFCFSSCIFVYFLLPETKGKNLEEIEQFFEQRFQKKESERTKTPI